MADNKAAEAAKAMPKTAVFKHLAEKTGLEPKQVSAVFEALDELIKEQLSKKGPGEFAILDLIKIKMTPATKGGELVKNPFTGEMVPAKPKPAKVKAVALKGLKSLEK